MRSPLATPLSHFGAYATPDTLRVLRRYRSGLGTSVLVGEVASKGASLAAGAAATAALTAVGGAALGAAAGSVVPVVGTIIGAVVGYLTSKLFGHANYAAVYANADNVQELFEAYQQVAGQYPGRVYGWPEIQYVFHGAMIWGLFTGNGPANPGSCTQAMISSNINACGNGGYVDDWLGVGSAAGDAVAGTASTPPRPGSGSNNCLNLIGTAISHGVLDPRQIASQYLVPGAEAVSAGKNNSWISVAHSRSPQLYTQMLIDLADVIAFGANPNLPVYYGSIPGASAVAQPQVAGATTPVKIGATTSPASPATSAPVTIAASPVTTAPVVTTPIEASPVGTQIYGGSAATLNTAQGTWAFGAPGAGGYEIMLNGANAGGGYGLLLTVTAAGLQTTNNSGVYQWNGYQWNLISAAATPTTPAGTPVAPTTAGTPTPANSPAGSAITPSAGGSLISPAGTWSFSSVNDGNGNYQILLNGSAAAAGNSNATQLQINSSGTVVATISNGSTYGWGSGGWTSISGPITSVAVSTPSTVSPNQATILAGGTGDLVTAQGEWTFSIEGDGTGNYYVELNGTLAGSETGTQLSILNGIPTLLRNDGSTWGWSGTSWTQLTQPSSDPSDFTTLNPNAGSSTYTPGDDTSSYEGYSADGYASGYTDTSTAASTPAVAVVPASGMSTEEKIILFGGGGLALLALFFGLRHHGAAK
jgi:uncharacterized membrane protein (Fun14 family)